MEAARKIVDDYEFDHEVSRYNKKLVKDFLTELKSKKRSPRTINQYRYDMRITLTYILRYFENKRLIDLTRKEIRNLSILLQETGNSNSRVNRQMSCLRSCLEFVADDDDYDYEWNVGARVKGLGKAPVREITFLADDQINWLRDQLIKKGETLKAVYLMLSYVTAKRKGEVHQVKKEGLTERFYTNKVIGKRGKKFRLYYTPEVQGLIKRYMDERGEDDLPELFVRVQKNGKRNAYSKDTFNEWCKYFSRLLSMKEGINVHVNPHCLRHSRLDNLSQAGVSMKKLQTLANHEDMSTTASYLKERPEEDIADIYGMDASMLAAG